MKEPAEIFENVVRSALVIRPKKPLIDWVNSHEPGMLEEDVVLEGEVYLLPDFETVEEMEKWLKKFYDVIFTEQLFNWYMDEDMWVQNRTFKMFGEWFHYSFHTMIWDTVDGPVEKM